MECEDCQNESMDLSNKYCDVCAGIMKMKKQPSIASNNNPLQPNIEVTPSGGINFNLNGTNENEMEHLYDVFGPQLRTLMDHFAARTSSSREISKAYLTTMGKMKVDSNNSILIDCFIEIGGMKIMCVPASFTKVPMNTTIVGNIVNCDETCVPLASNLCNAVSSNNNSTSDHNKEIYLCPRGGITFARKAINAHTIGHAGGLVVIQSFPMWPFVMSDNANEIQAHGEPVDIPVVCVSRADGELMLEYVRACQNKKSSVSRKDLEIRMVFGEVVTECSICQEGMDFESMKQLQTESGESIINSNVSTADEDDAALIYKLPCRHCYHVTCVTQWLDSHNTCPMCRFQMPTERKMDGDLSTPFQPNTTLHDTFYH